MKLLSRSFRNRYRGSNIYKKKKEETAFLLFAICPAKKGQFCLREECLSELLLETDFPVQT